MDVPEVEVSQEVSLKECKRASLKNEYVAGDSKILRVTPGDSVLYQFVEDGSISVNRYNTYCQGVKLHLHHSQVVDKYLVLMQIRFSLEMETFLRNSAGNIIAQLSQKALPSDCRVKSGGCLAEAQTYIFQEDEPVCPYKKIRRVDLKPEGKQLLIDYHLGLLFNITSIYNCP